MPPSNSSGTKKLFNDGNIHQLFDVTLWLKGAFALSEIIAGIAAFFLTKTYLLAFVSWVTKSEFAEDPHDFIANFLLHSVQTLSVNAQVFAGVYLLAHGVIKLWLISGLLRQKLWYYPVSLCIFGLFVVYQVYRFAYSHSVWLLLITVLDIIVIALTWYEYRYKLLRD